MAHQQKQLPLAIERRKLFRLFLGLPLAGWALSKFPWSRPGSEAVQRTPAMSHLTLSKDATRLMETYPTPRYLPQGYAIIQATTEPVDGLRNASGRLPSQLRLVAARRGGAEEDFSHPILVFLAPSSGQAILSGTEDHIGVPSRLMPADTVVTAIYQDGMWGRGSALGTFAWNTATAHSLVFRHKGYVIAVRGSRQVGVDEAELRQVAAGIA